MLRQVESCFTRLLMLLTCRLLLPVSIYNHSMRRQVESCFTHLLVLLTCSDSSYLALYLVITVC